MLKKLFLLLLALAPKVLCVATISDIDKYGNEINLTVACSVQFHKQTLSDYQKSNLLQTQWFQNIVACILHPDDDKLVQNNVAARIVIDITDPHAVIDLDTVLEDIRTENTKNNVDNSDLDGINKHLLSVLNKTLTNDVYKNADIIRCAHFLDTPLYDAMLQTLINHNLKALPSYWKRLILESTDFTHESLALAGEILKDPLDERYEAVRMTFGQKINLNNLAIPKEDFDIISDIKNSYIEHNEQSKKARQNRNYSPFLSPAENSLATKLDAIVKSKKEWRETVKTHDREFAHARVKGYVTVPGVMVGTALCAGVTFGALAFATPIALWHKNWLAYYNPKELFKAFKKQPLTCIKKIFTRSPLLRSLSKVESDLLKASDLPNLEELLNILKMFHNQDDALTLGQIKQLAHAKRRGWWNLLTTQHAWENKAIIGIGATLGGLTFLANRGTFGDKVLMSFSVGLGLTAAVKLIRSCHTNPIKKTLPWIVGAGCLGGLAVYYTNTLWERGEINTKKQQYYTNIKTLQKEYAVKKDRETKIKQM